MLRIHACHPAVHLWLASDAPDLCPELYHDSRESLHVGLPAHVERWCEEFLSRVPWFIPDRYPTQEFPDAQYVLSPLPNMLPDKFVNLHFACYQDAFHFKLRWW